MKRAFIIAPAVLVVLVGGALVAPSFVDWDKYKPQAIQQIKSSSRMSMLLRPQVRSRSTLSGSRGWM